MIHSSYANNSRRKCPCCDSEQVNLDSEQSWFSFNSFSHGNYCWTADSWSLDKLKSYQTLFMQHFVSSLQQYCTSEWQKHYLYLCSDALWKKANSDQSAPVVFIVPVSKVRQSVRSIYIEGEKHTHEYLKSKNPTECCFNSGYLWAIELSPWMCEQILVWGSWMKRSHLKMLLCTYFQ